MAITTGLPFRRWALAAIVTAVSVMPAASLAMVFPVAGAITRTSSSPLGPMGSTDGMSQSTSCPVKSSNRSIRSSEVPKRVSVKAEISDAIGMTVSYSCTSFSSSASTFSWVQKEPHIANPTRSFLTQGHLVLLKCSRLRPG